jgi:hypothetical protein
MSPVAEIFAAFDDSPTKLARAIGAKVQTVFDWGKDPVNIPEWRRAAVLDAVKAEAEKKGTAISADTIAYLRAPAPKRTRKPADTSIAA